MLTPYLPYPLVSGGQIRTYNLLKNLGTKHQITLFSLIKDDSEKKHLKHLKPYCHQIKLFKRSQKPFTIKNILKAGFSAYPFVVTRNLVSDTIKAVREELKTGKYDLVHAETFYMMPNSPGNTKTPVILVEQTIEYLGYQSYANKTKFLPLKPLLSIDIKKIKKWEEFYWRHADKLITMSEVDRQYILRRHPDVGEVEVVANGVDMDGNHWSHLRHKPRRLCPHVRRSPGALHGLLRWHLQRHHRLLRIGGQGDTAGMRWDQPYHRPRFAQSWKNPSLGSLPTHQTAFRPSEDNVR